MDKELFRPEALDARRADWMGNVRLRAPRLTGPLAVLASLAAIMLLWFSLFGSYTHKERVHGRIVPQDGLLSVQATTNGVLSAVLVREGQHVRAGQSLLRIGSNIHISSFEAGTVGDIVGTQLDRQQRQLEADLKANGLATAQQAAALREQISALQRQVTTADARLRVRQLQARRARETYERIQPLVESRTVSVLQSQQYETDALNNEAQAESTLQEQMELRAHMADVQAQLTALPLTSQEKQRQIERTLADLVQSQARNDVQRTLVVSAPRAGIVSGLAVELGQATAPGHRLLTLIPEGSPMQAELWVPSRAIGALRRNGAVAMRYQAFPYQIYGLQYGRIDRISESPLSPEEIRARTGMIVSDASYQVTVILDLQRSTAGRDEVVPRAGMTLDAELLLERRRLYDLVIGPMRSLGNGLAQ